MERAWERKVALPRERDDLADVRLWCKQGLQVRAYQESNKSVDFADIGAYNIWCIARLSKYLLKKVQCCLSESMFVYIHIFL